MEKINRSALLPYTAQEICDNGGPLRYNRHSSTIAALFPRSGETTMAHQELVSDIESYPEFLPWCTEARVLSREHDEVRASIGFAVSGLTRSFTTRNYHQVNKIIEMQLVEGPFSSMHGCWQFDSLGDTGCRISLYIEYDFSSRMLGMVVGPVFNQIANTLVDSFRQRDVEISGAR